jgi:hypothetical protein
VRSFSKPDARETAEQLLKRVIVANAGRELKNGLGISKNKDIYYQNRP